MCTPTENTMHENSNDMKTPQMTIASLSPYTVLLFEFNVVLTNLDHTFMQESVDRVHVR